VNSQSYSYMMVAYDSCGNIRLESQVSNSIFLVCNSTDAQNSISWNPYSYWLNDVADYNIYRTVDGLPIDGQLMASNNPSTQTYTDMLAGVNPISAVCYWVMAEENSGNPYLNNAVSLSNTCCIIREARLFLPNAFHPGGKNNKFRPVPSPAFVDEQSFQMLIFSRWGQQIFETNDMINGWDGMINGQNAPVDLYSYVVTYKSIKGQDYTQRGTVTLIR